MSVLLSVLFLVLTLPFVPAVLSGVFQTFGACQEPPGLARLSPPFIPTRSDAGTPSSVSSQQQQQQLQEDELATGQIYRLLNFLLISKLPLLASFIVTVESSGAGFLYFNPWTPSEHWQARLISGSHGRLPKWFLIILDGWFLFPLMFSFSVEAVLLSCVVNLGFCFCGRHSGDYILFLFLHFTLNIFLP